MAGKKQKDSSCGYTFTSLEKIDKEFQWYKEYNWYSDISIEDVASKYLKTIGLVKVRCMLEVFGVPKLVLWCKNNLYGSKRIIQVGDNTNLPISLSQLVFQKVTRLSNPNKELKLPKAYDFITNHGAPKRLLPYFIDSLSRVKSNYFSV